MSYPTITENERIVFYREDFSVVGMFSMSGGEQPKISEAYDEYKYSVVPRDYEGFNGTASNLYFVPLQ